MSERRALAAVVMWLAAAFASRYLGVWLAVAPAALALAAMTLFYDRDVLRDGARSRGRALLVGAVGGLAMAGATYVIYPRFERYFPQFAGDKAALYRQFYSLEGAWRRLALVPVAAAEEIVWRGLVQGALLKAWGARRYGRPAALLATALIYAAVQLPVGAPLLIIAALACGLVWGALREWQGDVGAAVAAHVGWDVLILLVMPVGSG